MGRMQEVLAAALEMDDPGELEPQLQQLEQEVAATVPVMATGVEVGPTPLPSGDEVLLAAAGSTAMLMDGASGPVEVTIVGYRYTPQGLLYELARWRCCTYFGARVQTATSVNETGPVTRAGSASARSPAARGSGSSRNPCGSSRPRCASAVWTTDCPGDAVQRPGDAAWLSARARRCYGDPMKALTLKQPWAWAVVHGGKWIENRTWRPPAAIIGEPFAIHAGLKKPDEEDVADAVKCARVPRPHELQRGCIVALATITGFVEVDDDGEIVAFTGEGREAAALARRAVRSPWFSGPIGMYVSDVRPLSNPIPCTGALGFWTVPADLEPRVRAALRRNARRVGDR
jgi:hypothetical protein